MPNKTEIIRFRAKISSGLVLRKEGRITDVSDMLFLYGADASGIERELFRVEMDEAHKDKFDELTDELPRAGHIAVAQAMLARMESMKNMAGLVREVRNSRK
ncbi:hypothetical protein CJP72_05315 [Citrobacter sp. NCU1]|uniref:hypothetical protein n=1 Tax=Citrobacter sp. NCU1 TaxID=2026683 RepID=UPI001391CF3C|nr:hypothetical protein [Citrobacter sp. NCU1]NDO80216.1 hypothetical protein [Citrobacter sp. NCU1]